VLPCDLNVRLVSVIDASYSQCSWRTTIVWMVFDLSSDVFLCAAQTTVELSPSAAGVRPPSVAQPLMMPQPGSASSGGITSVSELARSTPTSEVTAREPEALSSGIDLAILPLICSSNFLGVRASLSRPITPGPCRPRLAWHVLIPWGRTPTPMLGHSLRTLRGRLLVQPRCSSAAGRRRLRR